jgi:hypothetical protein
VYIHAIYLAITHEISTLTRQQYGEVIATAPIKKGEEILINYLDPFATSAARREDLQARWRFCCECPLCARSPREVAASDKRREDMSKAIGLLVACEATGSGSDRVVVGDLGWKVLEALAPKEGVSDLKLFQA